MHIDFKPPGWPKKIRVCKEHKDGPCANSNPQPGTPMEMVKPKDLSSHENGRKKSNMNLTQKMLTWVIKQISFEILNKLVPPQLTTGNNLRLICG